MASTRFGTSAGCSAAYLDGALRGARTFWSWSPRPYCERATAKKRSVLATVPPSRGARTVNSHFGVGLMMRTVMQTRSRSCHADVARITGRRRLGLTSRTFMSQPDAPAIPYRTTPRRISPSHLKAGVADALLVQAETVSPNALDPETIGRWLQFPDERVACAVIRTFRSVLD